ncbi:MAG: adenylyl-sulfate kinase [Candidatus Heimdallarchaeota archaeon]|nr:adenylyl-sulfate kinase [Candidatus Heimdallarchaeota archaeon]
MDKGFVIWLTGLSGSGKSTLVGALRELLKKRNIRFEMFDGDEVRKNLSPDLGFTKEDRNLHNKRVIYMCKLLERNGIVSVVSLISPYRSTRDFARNEISRFVEVWVNCPIDECIKRDPKGLYKKALSGEIKDMTGIQHPYEEPVNPEITVDTLKYDVEECAGKIIDRCVELGYLK